MQIIDMTSLVCGLVFFGPFWPFVGRLMGFCLAALKMESNGSPVNGSDSNGSKKKSDRDSSWSGSNLPVEQLMSHESMVKAHGGLV